MSTPTSPGPPLRSDETARSTAGRQLLTFIVIVGISLCLTCCGGPYLAYLVIFNSFENYMEAPGTPKPLRPNELYSWVLEQRRGRKVVELYDATRGNVDLRSIVVDVNLGPEFEDHPHEPLDSPQSPWGAARLVFHGEQDNQKVLCWFDDADSLAHISTGQELVVRGHHSVTQGDYPLPHDSDDRNWFIVVLRHCRIVRNN